MSAILWFGNVGFLLLVVLATNGIRSRSFFWAWGLLYTLGMLTFVRWAIDLGAFDFTTGRLINSFTPWMVLVALTERRFRWPWVHHD